MNDSHLPLPDSGLLDERGPILFREIFGSLLLRSRTVDTAILRIRLSAVDLSEGEVTSLTRLRVLVAEVSARTLEEEAYALLVDPEKRENLERILHLLRVNAIEIRSAPLGGWSPDFSVFAGEGGPHSVLLGLHWFRRPFPHRGPAWACWFGEEEARSASKRFDAIWEEAHDIGPAIRRLIEGAARRWEEGRTGHGHGLGWTSPRPTGTRER